MVEYWMLRWEYLRSMAILSVQIAKRTLKSFCLTSPNGFREVRRMVETG
jgi:hypothetical protein